MHFGHLKVNITAAHGRLKHRFVGRIGRHIRCLAAFLNIIITNGATGFFVSIIKVQGLGLN